MQISKDIKYVGVDDRALDLFESQYQVPNGISYNSYLILDERVAVMDTVDAKFGEEWIEKLKAELCGRSPDYLVIHHMEPDHSSNISLFAREFPNARVVASDKAFVMMKQFFGDDYSGRRVVVRGGDTLSLGKRELEFIAAPMVHWPEVMVSYDPVDRALFSADAFGKFGALTVDEPWEDEARRYYFCIVGKYGAQTRALLNKISHLDIRRICPLHGPVLSLNIEHYLDLYRTWSEYGAEDDGVFIAYSSVYGNTKRAALLLEEKLLELGARVVCCDLARSDISKAIENAFKHSKLALATTTYNAEIFPCMREFISELLERGYKNRTVAIIENGSWAPMAAKRIKELFSSSSNIKICENTVTIRSSLDAAGEERIEILARELLS